MPARPLRVCLCFLAACLPGCADIKVGDISWPWSKQPPAKDPPPDPPQPEQEDPREREIRKLRLEVQALQADKATLEAKIQHLERRELDLAERARKLKFANDLLSEQVKGLAPAPLERDQYKAMAQGLSIDVHRLRKENADLKRRVAKLMGADLGPPTRPAKPTTRPTTRPAAGD